MKTMTAGEQWHWQAGRVWKEGGETIALVPCDDPLQDGAMEEQVRRSKLLASAPSLLAERDRLREALAAALDRLRCANLTRAPRQGQLATDDIEAALAEKGQP